ncbi:hypothetical protein [Streptomyces chilikensis]|uniref:hypothetical protein n=1 Tax=Streptomyces chilikensis TaxID=1194079 RepID=UPI000B12571F|nr:hypothetical protein [Streptomyces chilikensis]
MRTKITMSATVVAAAMALLAGTTTNAGADVRHGSCGGSRQPKDRVCLMAEDPQDPILYMHIETRKGHDWAWTDGMVADGGHLWMETRHQGKTTRKFDRRAPSDGTSAMTRLSTPAVYDGPGHQARACADGPRGQHKTCTRWY